MRVSGFIETCVEIGGYDVFKCIFFGLGLNICLIFFLFLCYSLLDIFNEFFFIVYAFICFDYELFKDRDIIFILIYFILYR